MDIYSYQPETGEFSGTSTAAPSPCEPGVFMTPAHSTEIAPPPAGQNQVAVFDSVAGQWAISPDFRGQKRYSTADGREVEIKDLGALADVAPDTTDEPMPAAPDGQKTVWDGNAWAFEDLPPPPPPESVTMRQARLALLQAGLLSQVDTAIAGMSGADGQAARIEWEYATEIRRDNPLFEALAAQLGLSDAQLDALFMTAAGL